MLPIFSNLRKSFPKVFEKPVSLYFQRLIWFRYTSPRFLNALSLRQLAPLLLQKVDPPSFPLSFPLWQIVLLLPVTGGWDFGAYNARLYKQDNRYQKRIGGWCAKDKQNGHWLQVDLGKIKFVTAVATQGKDAPHVWFKRTSLESLLTYWN